MAESTDRLPSASNRSPWPHRWAVALAAITFPLIWVGGLVTTQDAGMAVPDWPGTFGYNLFAYPLESWWSGPWDLFIEHGHRLLGALAGFVAILLVIATWRSESRRSVRLMALGALVLVILQGTLGGVRVLAADREIAKLHGCVGPAFFALVVAIATMTGRAWAEPARRSVRTSDWVWSLLFLIAVYVQLVLGANLRHIAVEAAPSVFRSIVLFHLGTAAIVAIIGVQMMLLTFDYRLGTTRRLPWRIGALIVVQLALGAGTWLVKYGLFEPLDSWAWFANWVVPAKGMLQANVVTLHVAVGSALIAMGVNQTLRIGRETLFAAAETTTTPAATASSVPADRADQRMSGAAV